MEALRGWLLGIMAVAMVLSILYSLLPKGSIRSISRMTGGLILLLVMLRPIVGGDWNRLISRYSDYQVHISSQIETYQEENEKERERLIQEKTAAYILDKAAQMGITCRVQVGTEIREGVPYPASVTLNTVKDKDLSQIIEQELAIPEERQVWLGE